MYAVVGCSECSALWIVQGRPDTTQCPRCGTRRTFDSLRKFVETDTVDSARQIRASMLAERQDLGEAFDDLDSYGEMERHVEEPVVDDEEYLESNGIDVEATTEAGERASSGAGGATSREAVVREALRTLESPEEDEIVTYASERGVPAEYTRKALQSLVRTGDVSENRGSYRLL